MDQANSNTQLPSVKVPPVQAAPIQKGRITQPPTISTHPEHAPISPPLNMEQLRAIETIPAPAPNVEATPEVKISQELKEAGVEHGPDTTRDIQDQLLRQNVAAALPQTKSGTTLTLPDDVSLPIPYDQTVNLLKTSSNWDSKTWLALQIQRVWRRFNPFLK